MSSYSFNFNFLIIIYFKGHIARDNIILQEVIGEGEFGSVYKGILQTREGYEVLFLFIFLNTIRRY